MLDLVLSLSVLSAHPQRMVTLFLGPGVFRIDCKSVSFHFTDIDNYQEHMQPWKQRLADEAQAPQLSGLQKLTLVHECESTHRHKHSWPLWGHQTWSQQHLHLIFRNTRRYQNPQGEQRTAENRLDSLLPLTFSSHLILLEKHNRHRSQFIYACPQWRERDQAIRLTSWDTLDLEWDSWLRANTRSGFSWN